MSESNFSNMESIKLLGFPFLVGGFQSSVVGSLIARDLFRNRFLSRHPIAESQTQQQIRKRPSRAPVSVRERMNPVQPPQRVRGQMNRCTILPIVVHVVAHLFDDARYQVRTDRLVPAPLDFNSRRRPVARKRADPLKSNSVQVQQIGGTDLELAVRMREGLNHRSEE